MEILDDRPFFPPTQWTRYLPPNTKLEWSSKGVDDSAKDVPWWVVLTVGFIVAIFGILLTLDLLQTILRESSRDWVILSLGLLFLFTGLALCWTSVQQWRQSTVVRCGASAQHLYVWSPQTGLRTWAWRELPTLQCQSFPLGTISVRQIEKDKEAYLFEHIQGTYEDFELLTKLQQAAIDDADFGHA